MSGATIEGLARAAASGVTRAYGLTPVATAYALSRLIEAGAGEPWVVIAPDEATARRLAGDARWFLPDSDSGDPAAPPAAARIPGLDTSPYAELTPDRPALMGRMAALYRLAAGAPLRPRVLVVSAHSLLRRVMPAAELRELSGAITAGEDLDRDATAARLLAAGYTRVSVVEDAGSFAVRGGVIDLFPPLYTYPVRVELFGDTVESIRLFDPHSQRTLRPLERAHIHPVRETVPTGGANVRARILEAADAAAQPSTATRRLIDQIESGADFVGVETLTPAFHERMAPLWSYFPEDARWLIFDPDAIFGAAADELEVAEARYRERLADHKLAFEPAEHYATIDELRAALSAPPRRIEVRGLELHEPESDGEALRFAVDDNRALRTELERVRRQHADELLHPLVAAVGRWRGEGWRVAIGSGSAARTERLVGLLGEYDVPVTTRDDARFDALAPGGPLTIVRGAPSGGFAMPAEGLALVVDDDVFGARRRDSWRQKAAARRARDALLGGVSDFSQLEPGNYLVHRVHGVGLYRGLAKPMELGGNPIDFLHLEYDGGTLYLPVYRLGEVQRYVGAEGHKPRLDKLGGLTWDKARKKAARHVRALAEELLQLYAQRAALPGHQFPPADSMFSEFEATFEFEETPDQQKAIDDVLADMEGERPMDRLICGDVGYGKTEVALRATLKAVLGGKQVAMLAPTTVLVEQHFQTMRRRFEGWPVNVGRLSRFQPRREQLETVRGLAEGRIDAVVGTHRLLSRDVRFKELGLLIIDEEQRFGVTHKERLKKLRTQLDVLTLTATPIPRTLHLAMAGLRDLSIIATPPADRRSIRTFVSQVDDGVLREGIRRELGRGGQVFFVAPRIGAEGASRDRSLVEWANHLRELVPEARVAVAHGQMSTDELEKAMVDFVAGASDVLVSTTIIESGLDIPRANTMFVARADAFGLAQLYQLRGRIGRSTERAFCYLLVPPPEQLTGEARRRLETLQRFTELGAGFQIASHDLEIRGAGELLGARQSGSIAAVGFDAYTQMLEEAVAELRGEEIHRLEDPELNVDVPGFIPDDYVPDTGQRLDLYKRLSSTEDEDEVRQILDEMTDRYGPLPVDVTRLADLMVLKAHARRLHAQSVELTRTRLSVALGPDTPLRAERVTELVARPNSPYRLTPDMRLQRRFDDAEQVEPTAAARATLLELAACAT